MASRPRVATRREERAGGAVTYVTFEHEGRLNALGADLMRELRLTLDELAHDEWLRCVVLTGAGERAFSAGANINELGQLGYPSEARAFIDKVHDCCEAVRSLPMPVIARINGAALGAGLELAISCDLRVASKNAVFGMPEVKVGVPSVVEAALLPGLIGWGRTREMLLLGETCDAKAALAMGLVDAVVTADQLDGAVEKRVSALFAAAPQAVRLQKALMRRWENLPMREAIAAGAETFADAFLSREPSETIEAWRAERAKRKSKG